ncbi:hypothetical protein CY0110_28809 [Crocosphaera chwakensis CCY0110]|uniref:Uncharacterized protein n=2 Tax=Crocosphaera TaxID=263510 RepID=A3ISY2_9CHRO|nr:hypothetical protein CY0110_28809 [Crocosphaera chwakensis CCY0110]
MELLIMKGFIITGLSSLVLGSFFTPVNATEIMAVNSTVEQNQISYLSPINLVSHGRSGTFSEQGIPSHIRFSLAIKSGKVDAESLVKAAVEAGRLSSETLNNSSYLSNVQFELSQVDND